MSNKHHTPSNTNTNTQNVTTDIKGELSYDNKVVQKIIGLALEHVDGLLAIDGGFFSNLADKIVNTDNVTSGVNVEVGKEQVAVDLNVVVEYKKNVPDLYKEIKRVVSKEISDMTSLEVVEVNVKVVDIKTKEQHEADSVSLQDHVTNFAESTGEFASDTFEKAKEGIGSGVAVVTEKVGEGYEATKEVLGNGFEAAKDAVGNGVEAAKDAISSGEDKAKEAAKDGAQAVKETVSSNEAPKPSRVN
jgi:gls24 protein